MENTQARSLIRETFTQPFNKARFQVFVRNLLNRIDESKAKPERVNDFETTGRSNLV